MAIEAGIVFKNQLTHVDVELKCNFLAKNCEIFNRLSFISEVKCVNSHYTLVNLTVMQWMY